MIKRVILASLIVMGLVLGSSQAVKAIASFKATRLFEELCTTEAHLDMSEAIAHCPISNKAYDSGILQRVIDNETKTGKITTFEEIRGMVKK